MHFDADQYVSAMEPLTITIDGKEYEGRCLSALEMASRYQRYYDKLQTDTITVPDWKVFTARFINDTFGWRVWRKFKKLPEEAQVAAMTSFMRAQARKTERERERLGAEESDGIPIVASPSASPSPDSSPPTDTQRGETTTGPPPTA